MKKRLVLFVEGDGDREAVPILVKRILNEINGWEHVYLHQDAFKVKHVNNITGRKADEWLRMLAAATKLRDLGGILLLLDGDCRFVEQEGTGRQEEFCAAKVAQRLALKARHVGAGAIFSVACVFACREYESWLLAGAESLRGRPLPDGRPGVPANVQLFDGDTEVAPRGAKGWFDERIPGGYRPTVHQRPLTELVDLATIRARVPQVRSFDRLTHAVQELCDAIKTGRHVATPGEPSVPSAPA